MMKAFDNFIQSEKGLKIWGSDIYAAKLAWKAALEWVKEQIQKDTGFFYTIKEIEQELEE